MAHAQLPSTAPYVVPHIQHSGSLYERATAIPHVGIELFDLYRLALLIGHIRADAAREVGR
jgi:hypothetical protein